MDNAFNNYSNAVNNGFTMTFANGITVSVRWGNMNYCDQGKTTAECAAWWSDQSWVHIEGFEYGYDDVLADLTADDVALFIHNAANRKTA